MRYVVIAVLCALLLSADDCHLYCGYWWQDAWIPGYVSQESRFAELPEKVKGSALFYGPGVMEATIDYYGLELGEAIDGVSLLTCAELGQYVWISRGGPYEGPFLVADCSGRDDLYAHVFYRDEVVEVGFKTALKWGMVTERYSSGKPYTVKKWLIKDVVVSRLPPGQMSKQPVRMDEWFESVLTFAKPHDDKCRLVYHAPNSIWNDGKYPLWRVNCVWKTYSPLYVD